MEMQEHLGFLDVLHGFTTWSERYPMVGNSAKLVLMRGRTRHLWTLAGSVALGFLLVFACHPGFVVGAPAGMSAPAAPTVSIESTSAAKLLQSQFDWHGHALQSAGLWFALAAIRARHGARQGTDTAPPYYGPLHRRPPPSFS
ncbi:MAG TPA: hypothetical protein VGZ73_25475 [Bryobacteraceae bacterium]|jgi:hypothetical protein|nr:hypothetical protein [Bryobacteraceae bacterium]